MEKEIAKQKAQQQSQNTMIYKGVKGFRSGESDAGEFDGIAEKFKLDANRQLKEYNTKSA